ncbi:MAG: lipoprotein-releasing ABC transporter permease subunit [Candidatus Sumerlaeia bacterium]
MGFEAFISRRYLFSREHRLLVSIITVISILGVVVGVAALISVMAVMDGFDEVLVDRLQGVFSHLEVRAGFGDEGLRDYEGVVRRLEARPDVLAASPLYDREAFFQRETGINATKAPARLLGVDYDREIRVVDFMRDDKIVVGSARPGFMEVVVGVELAKRLHNGLRPLNVGDEVYAITRLARTAQGPMAKTVRFRVAGIFKSGLYDVDAAFAYVSLETMRAASLLGDESVDLVHARVKRPFQMREIKAELAREFPWPRFLVRTWEELHPQFFQALFMEKVAMFVILLLIIVVAAFNIISTLIMVVGQKRRDIGILKSMGATQKSIYRIFLLHGVFIGAVGTALGVALGYAICFVIEHFISYRLPEGIYGIEQLPVKIRLDWLALIVIATLLICVGASVLPARQAARLDPVEALRYE